MEYNIKTRQVLMDFHLSGELDNIGANFDEKTYTDTLKNSRINLTIVFAKCHHGWFYYNDTKFTKHPHLKTNLLPRMLAACKKEGISNTVYVSAGFDEVNAEKHHDWIFKFKDGTTERAKSFEEPGYHLMCFNTDYVIELCNQLEEVMQKFNPEGLFIDICYTQYCYCEKCRKDMKERNIDVEDFEQVKMFSNEVYAKFTKRVTDTIRKYSETTKIFFNGGHFYRGRRDWANYNTHYEIESLPTGGWGYDHFPLSVNYLEQLGKEYLGMTGKFNTTWGEFGGYKDKHALLYEVGLFMCFGAKCSIGDQINFDGTLEPLTYSNIGYAYEHVEKMEDFVYPSKKTTEIGVFCMEASNGIYNPATDRGLIRILLKNHNQFDFIDSESDLSKYKLIILADGVVVKDKLKENIDKFVQNGGKLLITGESALENGNFIYDVGAKFIGKDAINPSYVSCENITGVKANNVVYSDSFDVECTGNLLAKKYKPYGNREGRHFCSHQHWMDDRSKYYPGITEGKDGIYVAYRIFDDFANYGSVEIRKILNELINRLLGYDSIIKSNLPNQAISTVRTQESKNRYIVQILYGIAYPAAPTLPLIDDIPYLCDTEMSIKVDKKIKKVYTASGKKLKFKQVGDRCNFSLDKMYCHEVICLEY